MQIISILPCNGDSAAGRITRLAAQELVLNGQARWCLSWRQIGKLLEKAGDNTSPFVIVDGCGMLLQITRKTPQRLPRFLENNHEH